MKEQEAYIRRETSSKPMPSAWVMVHIDVLSNRLNTHRDKYINTGTRILFRCVLSMLYESEYVHIAWDIQQDMHINITTYKWRNFISQIVNCNKTLIMLPKALWLPSPLVETIELYILKKKKNLHNVIGIRF